MEPTTILAIANFGMSLLKKSGPNPMDALVEMLKGINKKLDVIKSELDIIHKKLFQLPQDIDYLQRINDLKKEFTVVDYYNRLLKKDEEEFGEKLGKKKFIEKNADDVENTILQILKNVGILEGSNDPISVNLVCLASTIDFELSKIINRKSSYQESSQIEYFSFLKTALYDTPKGLEEKVFQQNQEIDNSIAYKRINKQQNISRYWNCLERERHGGGEWRFKSLSGTESVTSICVRSEMKVRSRSNVIKLEYPVFKERSLSNEEIAIYEYLNENASNSNINLEFEKLVLETISQEQANSFLGKYVIKTNSTHYNDKERDGDRKKYYRPAPTPIHHKLFKEDLQMTINKYILNRISMLNAIETLNKINNYNF